MSLGTKIGRLRLVGPVVAVVATVLTIGLLTTATHAQDAAAALDDLENQFVRYHAGPAGGETIDLLTTENYGMLFDSDWQSYYDSLLDEMIATAAVLQASDVAEVQQLGADLDQGAREVKAGNPAFNAEGRITSGRALLENTVEPGIAAARAALEAAAPAAEPTATPTPTATPAAGAAEATPTPAPAAEAQAAAPETGNAGLADQGASPWLLLSLAALALATVVGARTVTGRTR